MRVQRNDPCPCGSGRKYKHCCFSQDETYLSYRKIEGVLQNELSDWAVERYGSSARKKARKNFEEGFETPPTVIDEESFLFETWFYYDWCPQGDPPLAMSYLKQNGDAVPTRARDLILATCAGHYSLHEVVDVQRGRGATLADLLTGKGEFVIDFNGWRQKYTTCRRVRPTRAD